MKPKERCTVPGCGQVKRGSNHLGDSYDHDYLPPRKEGQWGRPSLRPRSERPKRSQRRQEGAQHAREHHQAVRHCEAPSHGIQSPCGAPGTSEAILEHSHTVAKGMGGGKDYAVSDGECAILCRKHHRELDTDRATFRAAGLSKRAPSPQPPRRSVHIGE